MKQKFFSLFFLLALFCPYANAQKEIYIPTKMKSDSEGYSETDESKMWCLKRSRQSENCIVFWQSGYGTNDPNSSAVPSEYRVDVDDLLNKLESFYDYYINTLKFAEVGQGKSFLDKYKFIVCLYYTTTWMAYGSGFDDTIGGMWINPSTCHPVGSTIGHEMGHSFQYQCHCDLKGYAGFNYNIGKGCAFWEQTAQWMAFMKYPEETFTHWQFANYPQNCQYAFLHEDTRYNNYLFHHFLADKYGVDIIARIWRGGTYDGQDANQVLMKINKLSTSDFYKDCYEAAAKMATWDFDRIRDYGKDYIGSHRYEYYETEDGKFQVAYSSCPQATGYNLIPLKVPAGGGEVTAVFNALRPGAALCADDPGLCKIDANGTKDTVTTYNSVSNSYNRGFRLGFVALCKDGTRVYESKDTVYAQGSSMSHDTLSFNVPADAERMWMVVSPAPKVYYRHEWDETNRNDDQWPYRVSFENTDILDHVQTGPAGAEVCDTVYHCYVGVTPTTGNDYSGTFVKLEGALGEAIGKSLRMQPKEIANHIKDWSTKQDEGDITVWALNPKNLKVVYTGSTSSTGYGHWFNADGTVVKFGNNQKIYSEYRPASNAFVIGTSPNATTAGQEYTLAQAFKYIKNGKTAMAKIVFHIYIGGIPEGISQTIKEDGVDAVNVYSIDGKLVRSKAKPADATKNLPPGVYIVGSKKVIVK